MLLGSAYGKVELDSSGVTRGVKSATTSLQGLSGSAEKLGAAMQSLGKKMTVAVTLPILALGTASIKLASDMVETQSKVKVVFGEMTDSVMEWSEGSAKSMQLSQQEALEAAATFGNLFIAMKIGKTDAAEMSTTLVQLAADLGSINNIDPSLVLIKLKSGIVGETEAVRDLGIDLRQTVVEVKAAEMGFQKLNGQFSQGDLIAARYAIILEQTKVAQGDIARTGGELAGQLRQMNAQWKDALGLLGKNLLPIALKVVTALNKMLEAFNNLSPAQQKVIGGLILLVAVIGPLLILLGTVLPLVVGNATRSLNPFSGGILGLVFGFVKLVAAAAIVVKILTFLGIATGPVGAGILALNTAIAGTGAAILTALTPILIILGAILFYVGILYIMWKTNFLGMRDNVTMFVKIVKSLWQALMAFLRGDTDAALAHVSEAFEAVRERIAKVFAGFSNFQAAWSNFMAFLRTALVRVRDYIVTAFTNTQWSQVGKLILFGIANGMLLGLPTLLLTASRVAASVLAQIKRSLGIKSPSTEAMKLGALTAQGYMIGLQNAMDPNLMGRAIARPVTSNNTQQQTIIQNFASGLTIRDVRGMIAENNAALIDRLNLALG